MNKLILIILVISISKAFSNDSKIKIRNPEWRSGLGSVESELIAEEEKNDVTRTPSQSSKHIKKKKGWVKPQRPEGWQYSAPNESPLDSSHSFDSPEWSKD